MPPRYGGRLENQLSASRKSQEQLLPNISTVEDFNTGNIPGDNVKYHHPIFRHQAHILVTGTEATLESRLRVKRGADVVPAAASVQNRQSRDLSSQSGFVLLFEKLAKLG